MNKQIALSAMSILAAMTLMSGAAFAFFTDSGTSSNNTFASGTLDLVLSDDNQTDQDNVTATFGGSNLAPGDCLTSSTLNIKNTGSVAGNHVDISATNTNSTFAAFLRLKTLTFDVTNITLADSNDNGFRDLQDLATNGIVDKAVTDQNKHPLVMEICLDSSATSAQEGQTNTLSLGVLLDQGPHPTPTPNP